MPYAWQEKNKTIEVPTAHSKRITVFGFMNKDCDTDTLCFTSEKSSNSTYVISCINSFCERITRPTALVLDNAPIHKSKKFMNMIEEWKEKGLRIFFLPTYSPHLNKIETLWRKMKYEWLDFSSYSSFQKLKENLNSVIQNLGTKYTINFA